MEAILNFRDFGGYRTRDGRSIRTRLLYRSGSLSTATASDQQELQNLGIKTVIDLRTHKERQSRPDRLPRQIASVHIPIKTSKHNESGFLWQLFSVLFGKARKIDYHQMMIEVYQEYVTHFQKEFAQILKLIAEPHNLPVLIHCTGGKDRTGFACWLIHLLLDLPHEVALADYLKTNDYALTSNPDIQHWIKALSLFGIPKERFLALLEARADYLNAANELITQIFGTVENFALYGLKLSESELIAIKNALIE
ncbi:MAG: tyrosine-protein phosphatase [candidate division KSB1 bacterium]|nr:tyrosine-protein phosphatase [candidate division KSB1 bacterium]MDZ7334614.1 tyrosine-protein phosphatase [candidate division KSB1 bacterium]MDZ7399895.1 tyrosine-protein phosphatase [candidate division KSB1 bacterium]